MNLTKAILLIFGTTQLIACHSPRLPQLAIEQDTLQFETYPKQEMTTDFRFTNLGNDTLKILSANADCSCSTVDYPKGPILPGQSGLISVTHHADSTIGLVRRYIMVEAYTQPTLHALVLMGEVKKLEDR
jgi:hypothetical protein